jgi:hypothetical protein
MNRTLCWLGTVAGLFLVVTWPFWMVKHNDHDWWLEGLFALSAMTQVRDLVRSYREAR